MHFLRLAAMAAACVLFPIATALAKPPLEAFGEQPEIRSAELSPDGTKIAFLQRVDDKDYVVVHDFATKVSTPLANVMDLRARTLYFAGEDHVVAVASKTTRMIGYRGKWEASAAFAINLKTRKIVQLLAKTEDLYPAQGGLGDVVGVDPDGKTVYMPAFMGRGPDPTFDLLKVDLETGRGRRSSWGKGTSNTIDWLVTADGEPLVEERFNYKENKHDVRVREGSGWRTLLSETGQGVGSSIIGVSVKGDALIARANTDSEYLALHEISIRDGTITGAAFEKADANVEGVLMDSNRIVYGVSYSGMYPTYQMLDPKLDAELRAAQAAIPGASVWIDSWSKDWSKVLLVAEGGGAGERYALFDRAKKTVNIVAHGRPELTSADFGDVVEMYYMARDGLKIPGVLTWPAGMPADQRRNLPMVMLPHGGPEAYDRIGFDWLAQFLANEGYLVMQPNFRGSDGFGASFQEAGHGEWGRKMQDDISDGVNAAVAMGLVDPERVCILGWSYGGYAALAGGALTPELYKCVVSVAGVSDLRDMLADEKRQHSERPWIYDYWVKLIGDPAKIRDAIDAVSPYRLAEKFTAPVLMIHGTEDLIVPVRQSERMEDALKAKGKAVTFLKMKGDDHSLVENESRRQTLGAIADFLAQHIGGKPAGGGIAGEAGAAQ